jgi:D-alanyl-lipoteichoic acid acyltransferase DltB (MBOAT superfamily)
MNFTEYDFLIFFMIVLCGYWLLKRRAWQNALLLAASYIFYGWVHPWYAILLAVSTAVDYLLALRIADDPARKKTYLTLSIVFNVGVLAFFKYFGIFMADLFRGANIPSLQANDFVTQVVLPVGLSFYVLKKLGYILDVSRGTFPPVRDPLAFGLFVAFFPQINAGPIDRAQVLIPQIQADRVWKADNFYAAWPLIVMGFFKKVVIAGMVAVAVDRIFGLEAPTLLMLPIAGFGYAIQILADFSAYTDLSRGVSRLLGFETSENFNAPYLALTPTEFWNRWHITLSTWLRDYIFFPLRRSLLRARVHLPVQLVDALPPLVTMLVSGLWHGTGWNYIVWGGMYGVLIVVYQALGMGGNWKPANGFTRGLAWTVMFSFTILLFLIFRAPSLGWLYGVLRDSTWAGSADEVTSAVATLSMILCFGAPLAIKHFLDRHFRPDSNLHALFYVAATVVMFVYLNSSQPDFVYFKF